MYVTLQSLKKGRCSVIDLSCVTRGCCLVFRHVHYRGRGEELNMAVLWTHARCSLLNNSTFTPLNPIGFPVPLHFLPLSISLHHKFISQFLVFFSHSSLLPLVFPHLFYIRELKQGWRRQLRKHNLKSEFALLQTLLRWFHLIQFIKCWHFFSSRILKDCIKVQVSHRSCAVMAKLLFCQSKPIAFLPFLLTSLSSLLNPLSPNNDQHQFSPNDIHTLSRD